MSIDVVVLGETMMALRAQGPVALGGTFASSIAGAESNVAIGLSRLGHNVAWTGRVGDDPAGDLVLRTLRAERVDVGAARRDSAATGIIVFEQRLPHVHRAWYARAGSAGSRLSPSDVVVPGECRILHVTGITPALSDTAAAAAIAAAEQARATGTLVSFDINFRPRLWPRERAAPALSPLLALADVVIGSPDELALFDASGASAETLARRIVAGGAQEVVVKDGARSAFVLDVDGVARADAIAVQTVDPVGAGDAFVAGYLSALLDGLPVTQRLQRAHVLGAFAVSHAGDWEGLPTRDELELVSAEAGSVQR